LKEELEETREKYNEAHHDSVKVPILEKKLEDYKLMKEQNKKLDQELSQLRN